MSNTIEAVFDGAVFRPESNVALKPNTRVEITVTVKIINETSKEFRVRSKHLGFRKDLNYDKTSELLEEIEGADFRFFNPEIRNFLPTSEDLQIKNDDLQNKIEQLEAEIGRLKGNKKWAIGLD